MPFLSVWIKERAHTADLDLPCTASAGSTPSAQMSTRKRPRPAAQLEQAQPPSGDIDNKADVAANMDAEGVQSSPRPSRSAKQQGLHGSSEAQTQQLFQALHVLEQLALPELVRLADEHSIVWCRLKGFPAWPVSCTALFHLHESTSV